MRNHSSLIFRLSPAGAQNAFSLIEIVVALWVFAFAIAAVCSLLPLGLKSARNTEDETIAINLMGQILSDLRNSSATTTASPVFGITPVPEQFDGSTQPSDITFPSDVVASEVANHYGARVVYLQSQSTLSTGTVNFTPVQAKVIVFWPRQSGSSTPVAQIETLATFQK